MTAIWLLCLALSLGSVDGASVKTRYKRSERCPQDWRLYEDSCYIVRDLRYTFEQATNDCAAVGATVALADDADELNFIQGFFEEMEVMAESRYWMGARNISGQYTANDGTALDFSPWAYGEPDSTQGQCVAVGASTLWKAKNCNKLRRYLCEKPAGPPVLSRVTEIPITTVSEDDAVETTLPVATTVSVEVTEEPASPFQRTIVVMEKPTAPGQNLFFRGGIDHSRRTGCTLVAEESNCSIPIEVRDVVELPDGHVAAYRAWSQGDRFLDWYGPEEGQGDFNGQQAQGTPATWTTNDQSRDGYHPGNEFGDNYWLLDMDMDCSKTENGYFELKGFLGGQWEGTISDNQCEGVDPAPFTSTNHIAMCGALNIFHWNEGRCQILVAA